MPKREHSWIRADQIKKGDEICLVSQAHDLNSWRTVKETPEVVVTVDGPTVFVYYDDNRKPNPQEFDPSAKVAVADKE